MALTQHDSNGWIPAKHFMKVAIAMHTAATTDHTRWLGRMYCKYLELYVDQRTGDFLIRDSLGHVLPLDVVYEMFPDLK